MKSIKILLNQKWAKDFFNKKIGQYFPKKKLINCEVEPLKIYLNYKSVVVKYHLELLDEENNVSEKNIVGKAEKLSPFGRSPVGGKQNSNILNDYSATKFLRKQGLNDIVPKPIDYLPLFNLYLYEFIPGYFLQELSVKQKDQEFLDKIPNIIKSLRRIHEVKVKKKDKMIRQDRKQEEKQWQYDLKLVQEYFPVVFDKTLLWIKACRVLRNKYRKYFDSKVYQMTHGDFYSRNILVNPVRDKSLNGVNIGQIKLIDFSNSVIYEPLNDVGNFLINTELMFEYDFHDTYRLLIEKLKDILFQNYFSQPRTEEQEFKINYFILTNLIRIIAFAAMSEGSKKLSNQPSIVMEKLIRFGEEKYNNL